MKYKNRGSNCDKNLPNKLTKKSIFKSSLHPSELVPIDVEGLTKNFDARVKDFVNNLKKTPESILKRKCF